STVDVPFLVVPARLQLYRLIPDPNGQRHLGQSVVWFVVLDFDDGRYAEIGFVDVLVPECSPSVEKDFSFRRCRLVFHINWNATPDIRHGALGRRVAVRIALLSPFE